MENINQRQSVHQRKATKKSTKPKNKPIKVVYISNPMKVKTSASEFRALVQELTGQDAELPDPNRYPDIDNDVGARGHQTVPDPVLQTGDDDHSVEVPVVEGHQQQQPAESSNSHQYEAFDDVFTPQMIENFSSLLPRSVFYDSHDRMDELSRNYD